MPLSTLAGLPSALVLIVAFYGLGLGLLRLLKVRVVAFDGLYAVAAGWGTLVVLSILASFLKIPLSLILCGGLVAGVALAAVSVLRWNEGSLGLIGVGLVAVLPAILWTLSFPSVQFDEFGQWLPNAFYLFANDALPTAALPNLQTAKQGYPIAIPYVTYALSAIQGTWDDRTGKIFPLVLAALFASLLAGVFLRTDRPSASATAIATVFATVLNPFFDPRFAITTYSDVPTAFLLAAMVYALWRAGEGDPDMRGWLIRASLTAVTLIQLRQTNIVLVVGALLSVSLASLLVPPTDGIKAGLKRSGALALAFGIAPLAGFLIWQLHLWLESIGLDKLPRAPSAWNWSALRTVVASLLTERLANNPVSGAFAILLTFGLATAAALGWRHSSDDSKRLVVSVATVTLAQAALLVFSYIAIFTEEGVGRAASAWRYASHLGPLYMLAAAQLVPWERVANWRSWPFAWIPARVNSNIIVMGVVAVQVLFVGRWRIDCVYPHARPGYEALVSLFAKVPPQASVTVVNGGDGRFFLAATPLARVMATGDWRAPRATIVDKEETAPPSQYVIDLTGADPELFRQGQTTLRATLHRERLASSPIATVSVVTTCPAPESVK